MEDEATYSMFAGDKLLVSGDLATLIAKGKERFQRKPETTFLVFEDQSGKQLELDLSGTLEEALARAMPAPGRGRPKLGVVSREVTLFPRHWEWLEEQPNGISAALRRLVDAARKKAPGEHRARLAREAVHRFMTAMAGNRAGFEEALRALYAKDRARFEQLIRRWPADVRKHVERMAAPSF